MRNTAGYTVTDKRAPLTQYTFNVCDVVTPPYPDCWSGNRDPNKQPSQAWQMEGPPPIDCYRLGNAAGATGWNFSVFGAFSSRSAAARRLSPHAHPLPHHRPPPPYSPAC
jgi:hypothetical protein